MVAVKEPGDERSGDYIGQQLNHMNLMEGVILQGLTTTVDHPFIVSVQKMYKLAGVGGSLGAYALVMRMYTDRTLHYLMHQRLVHYRKLGEGEEQRELLPSGFTLDEVVYYAGVITSTVVFLDRALIAHRDIKVGGGRVLEVDGSSIQPDNVMLDVSGVPKLGDFGSAKVGGVFWETHMGGFETRCPEQAVGCLKSRHNGSNVEKEEHLDEGLENEPEETRPQRIYRPIVSGAGWRVACDLRRVNFFNFLNPSF